MKYNLDDIKDGMSFTATIQTKRDAYNQESYTCSGKIAVVAGEIFLCQDYANGIHSIDKKGFRYSWRLDHCVSNLIIYELELPGPSNMNISNIHLNEEELLLL